MVSRVTIELDDKSAPAFAKYIANVNRSDAETDELSGSVSKLESELEETRAQLESMALDLKEAADAQSRLNQQQKQGGGESSSYAEKITAISTGTLAVVSVIKQGVEAGKKFVQMVRTLADQGNPAAKELASAFDQVTKSFLTMAESPEVQAGFEKLASILKNDISPVVERLPSYWTRTQDAISGVITAATDYYGLTEGASEQLDQMLVQQEKTREQIVQQAAEEKEVARQKKIQVELDKIATAEAKARESMRVAEITDVKALQAAREGLVKKKDEEIKIVRDINTTEESRKEHLSEVESLTGRILEMDKQILDTGKKKAEDTKKFLSGLSADWKTLSGNVAQVYEKAVAEAQKHVATTIIAPQEARVKALVEQLNKMQGKDGQAQDVVSKIKGSITGEDIAKKVAEQRSAKEIEKFRKENADLVANAESGVDEFSSRRLRHEEDRIRNRARNKALGQAQAGGAGISEEEIANAEQALTQSVIDQAASQGKLTINQAEGLRAAARAAQESAKIQAEQAQDIKAITAVLDEITQGTKSLGQRQRAQRGSSGG